MNIVSYDAYRQLAGECEQLKTRNAVLESALQAAKRLFDEALPPKGQQPLSAEDRAVVEQYLAAVMCPKCNAEKTKGNQP
jgi:hypothetical protein